MSDVAISITLRTAEGIYTVTENKCVLVWNFDDAPAHYRRMSTHGGDEDGIVLVPNGIDIPYWMERMWEDPQITILPEGKLIIWTHA